MLYLDNAATTLRKPLSVYRDMLKYTCFLSANAGRGGHKYSLKAAEAVGNTAEELAELFNISDCSRIAFTPNSTLALNFAIQGTAAGKHIVVTALDHNSVLRPAHTFCRPTIVPADRHGFVAVQDIEKALRPDTALIVCTHISNVCGSIQQVEKIGKLARRYKIPFLLDASQSAGTVDIDVKKYNISMLAFSGHKSLLGPLGTGGLYVGEDVRLKPIICGGTGSSSESLSQPDFMPDLLQSGTLNTPAIAALGAGVRFIKKHTPKAILEHERMLAQRFIENLSVMKNVTLYGTHSIFLRNGTVAFNINSIGSGEASDILGTQYNIAVRGGWHCAYPTHIALGCERGGAVRVSFGIFNTIKDVRRITDAVYKMQK